MASKRVACPDLCIAAVKQFKSSTEFQMAIDATVAGGLSRKGEGGAGPSGVTAAGRTEEDIIQGFQQLDYYKHEMSQYWDSGWTSFKYKADELFPDVTLAW
ncbi:hypothetical protein CsSME_00012897 [Camellia sinensis var. sinensis]